MFNEIKKKIDLKLIITCVTVGIITTILFVLIFSLIMNLFETDFKYSPVFGSISVALGSFAAAYYLSAKKKSKGYICGLIVGGVTFIIVTLIGMIINNGGITINTLFHLIIFLLSALSGGVLGVNKKNGKFI